MSRGGTPSVGPRVEAGAVLTLITWSNTAITLTNDMLTGKIGVLNDDGSEKEYLIAADAAILNTRVAQTFRGDKVEKPCTVLWAAVNSLSPPAQRGQMYVLLGFSGNNPLLARGYLYAGHPLSMLSNDEPGPAGGHGARTFYTLNNPAAGVLPADNVSTGAIWRLISYEVVLVTDANVGNRSFALLIDDQTATRRIFATNNPNTQAATLTRTWAWFLGVDASATVGASFTDTQVLLPSYTLKDSLFMTGVTPVQHQMRLVSTGTLAFTATDDFAAAIIWVEEWVMPN